MDEKKGLEQIQECLLLAASEDWKTRLKGEYWETKIRCRRLEAAIKEREGQRDALDASYHIMQKQLDSMVSCLSCLALRAAAEDIDLLDTELPEDACAVLISGNEKEFDIHLKGMSHAITTVLFCAFCETMAQTKKNEVSAEEVAQELTKLLCKTIKRYEEAKA